MNHDGGTPTEDFGALERQLHDQRPVPTDAELGRVRHRAVTAASARRSDTTRGRFLSPARLAMVSLVSGAILVGGSGASLAVSGLSSDGSAGIAQYLQAPPSGSVPSADTGAVAPSQDQGAVPDEGDAGNTPSLDDGELAPAAGTDDTQDTRQVASGGSDGRLPFTGLLALPLLLTGVVLLSGGFLLRTQVSVDRSA